MAFYNTDSSAGDTIAYPCRAWANINAAYNPPTVGGSGGLTSFTDQGTGDHQFNFNFTLSTDDYSALCSCGSDGGWSMAPHIYSRSTILITSIRFSVNAVNASGTNYDREEFCMAVIMD